MQKPLRRSEHYREKAVKYHELAKFASPPYLGDFYRGVAVRYALMAQELSRQAEKELGLAAQPRDPHTSEVSTETTQDLNLLAVWAGWSTNHIEKPITFVGLQSAIF